MTRRLAAIFSLITLGAIATAPSAHAEVVNVDFAGKVAPSCTTAKVTPGKVALENGNNKGVGSRGDIATGGQLGSFELTCNGSADITISAPVAQAGTPTTQTQAAYLWDKIPTTNTGYLAQKKSDGTGTALATVAGPITNKTFYVEAAASNSSTAVPIGTYNYRVSLNITAK